MAVVFGKFVKDNNRIYRTEAYIDLDSNFSNNLAEITPEKLKEAIKGTIFMFNPGASHPERNPSFLEYNFGTYSLLEPDETMKKLIRILKVSKNEGLIEIKNLFNLREQSLTVADYESFVNEISNAAIHITEYKSCNIDWHPQFQGDFVFFAWGSSLLNGLKKEAKKTNNNQHIETYYRGIINFAGDQKKEICYVTKELIAFNAEQNGSFYHPRSINYNRKLLDIFIKALENKLKFDIHGNQLCHLQCIGKQISKITRLQ